MLKFIHRPVLSELAAGRLVWSAAFLILATCTALILKMLPEFGVVASVGLVSSLSFAWVVVGLQFARIVHR